MERWKGLHHHERSSRRARPEAWLEQQLLELFRGQVLPVTRAIAKRWGVFDGTRQMAGRPLSVPDGMIAATAFENGLVVVTRNVKDFEGLGVPIFNPRDDVIASKGSGQPL